MSASLSTLARNGSHASSSSSGYAQPASLLKYHLTNNSARSSTGLSLSSNNHIFNRFRTHTLPTWLHESWANQPNQYEGMAMGTLRLGMAVLTREMMEMHIQQAPDVRGMLDCLPVADKQDATFIGWRKKLPTWPVLKKEALTTRWM
jgi:hypothetical protein